MGSRPKKGEPRRILEQCDISEAVDLAVEGRKIVLTPLQTRPRIGWREAAARMADRGDDAPLLPDVFDDDMVALDQLRTIDKRRASKAVGRARPGVATRVKQVLHEMLVR